VSPQLVLIHGRSQERKDATTLKGNWIEALRRGLDKQGLSLSIVDADVRFPYYGDTLDQLVNGVPGGGEPAEVIIRGLEETGDTAEQQFVDAVLEEARQKAGITDAEVRQAGVEAGVVEAAVIDRGVRPTKWMHAVLKALDKHVPGASAPTLALVTRDVYQYLRNPTIRTTIENGVRQALRPGVPTVVIGHSLGTVVAYNLLRREAASNGWRIPLFVTLGSPLGVSAIRDALKPINRPPVDAWFNAADARDVVALWALAAPQFRVDPVVENKMDVVNHTDNRHGISGYLDDPVVAKRIHDALML
jgi:hypothetical protein